MVRIEPKLAFLVLHSTVLRASNKAEISALHPHTFFERLSIQHCQIGAKIVTKFESDTGTPYEIWLTRKDVSFQRPQTRRGIRR